MTKQSKRQIWFDESEVVFMYDLLGVVIGAWDVEHRHTSDEMRRCAFREASRRAEAIRKRFAPKEADLSRRSAPKEAEET